MFKHEDHTYSLKLNLSTDSDSDSSIECFRSKVKKHFVTIGTNNIYENQHPCSSTASTPISITKNIKNISTTEKKIPVINIHETDKQIPSPTIDGSFLETSQYTNEPISIYEDNNISLQNTTDLANLSVSPKQKNKVRKNVSNRQLWKTNILKDKHQAGKAYVNRRGKNVTEKQLKNLKDCTNTCKFECAKNISDNERKGIFQSFYKLSQNEKHFYYLNTTERTSTARPKRVDENKSSYKKFSFKYLFKIRNDDVRVCKMFYLGTLCISQTPIYNAHRNKDQNNVPKHDNRGQSSINSIPEGKIKEVMQHIASFHTVESHYCRATTSRQYLESHLNVMIMYDLYLKYCIENDISAVKLSMYRRIFMTKFNLSFHVKKSDRCDLCEEYLVAKDNNLLTENLSFKYSNHIKDKMAMREERDRDRKNDIPVLCFDLQNVISCPRAEVSSFYYRRKLNVYNLTAHYSATKTVYCATWNEAMSGRTGNDLASAFKNILDCLVAENEFTELITWSDSCIPQNRNSHISTAVLNFLGENPRISSVTMKYSVPGHSCIQEVDSAHSAIEKVMLKNEFFSPLSLIRVLKSVNRKKPLRILQMCANDFKDYSTASKCLNFKVVPFLKVSALQFTQVLREVGYKTSFSSNDYKTENLRISDTPKRKRNGIHVQSAIPISMLIQPKNIPDTQTNVSQQKICDIKDMLKSMPLEDRQYYKTLLKI